MKQSFFAGCLAVLILLMMPVLLLRPEAAPVQEEHPQASTAGPADGVSKAVPASAEAEPDDGQAFDEATSVTVLENGTPVQMQLGDYLTGVVLAEMPASFEPAALEAQAVASRTFVMYRKEHPKHPNADVCDDSACCQAYLDADGIREKLGENAELYLKKVRAALEATDGQVLTYGGALIDATYFSCSGGATESAAAVWGTDVPYLQSVDSPGEESSSRYSDSALIPIDQFRQTILNAEPDADLSGEPAGWFGAETKTEGGGVAVLQIGGADFTGTQLRSMFGLRSTRLSVAVESDGILFETYGNGHRVGMSQYGAQAMAKNGSDVEEILTHYYVGTELTTLTV